MTENTTARVIPAINAVDGFSPAEFTREIPNDDGTKSLYLDVKYRLLWFRLHRPEGKIDSEIIRVDDKSAVVSCRLYNDRKDPTEQYIARASAQRFFNSDKFGDRYLEIAETAAMGRVLAAAGYGTQFCSSSDMFSDVIADAPVEMGTNPQDGAVAGEEPEEKPMPQPIHEVTNPPKSAEPVTLEQLLDTMSLEDAKNVTVDFGRYAGMTLGQIAMIKPGDLDWYVRNYSGRNLALKAGSILLVRAASQKAG